MKHEQNIIERCQSERLHRLQALLTEGHVDALIVIDHHLLHWLGHPLHTRLLVTCDEVLPMDGQYLSNVLARREKGCLAVDSALTASQLLQLQQRAPNVQWKPFEREIARLLAVKDIVEIAFLRRAAQITTQVLASIAERLEDDPSEIDLLHGVYETFLTAGGEGFAFDPSIASGERSTLLWGGVTTRKIRRGEPVLVDLGISFQGYQCDMARSFIAGGRSAAPEARWRHALDALDEIMAFICEQIRPGAHCSELQHQCEQELARSGFAGSMHHALGHGIGLREKERPYLSSDSSDILAAGMVLAIEPGITLAHAGFRREDIVLVTEDGCVLLIDTLSVS